MLEGLNEYQFIIVALNIIILYVVLRKILFKPITEFMERRTQSIQDSLADAAKQKEEASELKCMYEEQMKTVKAEYVRIIDEATVKANRLFEIRMEEAKRDAQFLLANARNEIENERKQMLRDIRREVAGLALSAASRVMEANMNMENNHVLVDRFLDEAGVA